MWPSLLTSLHVATILGGSILLDRNWIGVFEPVTQIGAMPNALRLRYSYIMPPHQYSATTTWG